MPAPRGWFTPEYKREAVRLADDLGNAAQAARDLGINSNPSTGGGASSAQTEPAPSPATGTPATVDRPAQARAAEGAGAGGDPKKAVGIVSSPSL